MIENLWFLIRFLITLSAVIYCIFFLVRRQLVEIAQPKDAYTRLRRYILYFLLVVLFTLIPALVYQGLITLGFEYRMLRNIVSICGGITIVSLFICLHLIFTYQARK